jgi:hypothetical protein
MSVSQVSGVSEFLDPSLEDIAGLAKTDGNVIVGDGTNWVGKSVGTIISESSQGSIVGSDLIPWVDADDISALKTITLDNIGILFAYTFESLSNREAAGGYVSLDQYKIKTKNSSGTFISFITNENTASRTHILPDRDGTLADNTDLNLKANLASPTFSGTAIFNAVEIGVSDSMTPTGGLALNAPVNTVTLDLIPTSDDNNATTGSIRIWGTKFGTSNRHSEIKNITVGGTDGNNLVFFTNGNEVLRLDASGNIIVSGTIDGRDVAADGTKLDGIEALADVTDAANVTAAGALMDSEVINLADVKALAIGGTVQAYNLVLDELASQTIITETTTARILALTDANDYIRCTNAANTIITIPSEDSGSSIDFPIGTRIEIFRATAADVSIAAEAGVTLTYAEGLRIAATNKLAAIIKTGANAWDVIGALAA